ncbi:MAG: hypothetical protein EOP43_06310 [Sphingobacteriaceae bacterium]|nr:MAG: hypothetical protein EOP43_06310 [Sphingobacteriaceae bacterium]
MSTIFKTLIVTTALAFSAVAGPKTIILSDQSKLTYNISDDKKLNGAYILTTPDDKVSLKGAYKDDQRVGNWYTFNPDGTIFLRYNYDLKKLISIDTVAITRVKYEINTTDDEVKKGSNIPVPICSIEQYISLLGSEFKRKILKEDKTASGMLNVNLIANVDANGSARYSANYTIGGVKFNTKLIISEKMFDIEWLPASYKGQKIAGTFIISTQADFSTDPPKRQRFIWNY